MPLDWIDVSSLSFNCFLLMERAQIRWFPGWLPEPELATALHANPAVEWYLRNRCPEVSSWLDQVMARVTRPGGMIILCPGTGDTENAAHAYLVSQGFEWSRFEEPRDGIKRKYWKTLPLARADPA